MNKKEIIAQVQSLGLPADSFVVFGSCPMAIAGIRDARDIDLMVSEGLFENLKKEGWLELKKGEHDTPITRDVFEAHTSWKFSEYNPTLEHLLKTATVVDGIPFASLEEVRKWKSTGKRPKDITDLKLIDVHLAQQ